MARIRTVKPEFFRHRRLYVAEAETGLPLRVAFAGLWTVCDREGRFRWEPEELKLDCLPYDDVDFSRVLDALSTRGFVVKYACNGRQYGVVPSFPAHQVINNREAGSNLPAPPQGFENKQELTREPRVNHASTTRLVQDQGEGKGKEGKGREKEESPLSPPVGDKPKAKTSRRTSLPENFAVPPDWIAGAVERHGQGIDWHHEAERFTNHHRAKGSVMADWPAAWRTWTGNAVKYAGEKNAKRTAKNKPGNGFAQVWREVHGIDEGAANAGGMGQRGGQNDPDCLEIASNDFRRIED